MAYHICTKCPIHHYDNCPECFGFGFASEKIGSKVRTYPISAAKAHNNPGMESKPCPVCGSIAEGLSGGLEGIECPHCNGQGEICWEMCNWCEGCGYLFTGDETKGETE